MNMAAILSLFDTSIAYGLVLSFASWVLMILTPLLFLVAVFIRIMETQLDGLTSGGKWGQALKDIFVLGAAIGVYFGVFALIAAFVNPIYAWIEHTGSISAITDRFNQVIDAVKVKRGAQDYLDSAIGLTAVPFQVGSLTIYEVTLGLAMFFTLFLKLAHAFGFGVALVWGLIALPMSVTANLKLIRGWALLVGFILAWPLVQGLMISLFAPVFHGAANRLVQDVSTTADWNLVGVYLMFGLAHLLLAAILIAAPLVAAYLTANAPAGAVLVMPFAAAAAGATAALFKGKLRIPWSGPAKQNTPVPPLHSVPRQIAGNKSAAGPQPREALNRSQNSNSEFNSAQVRGEPAAIQQRAPGIRARTTPAVGGDGVRPTGATPVAAPQAESATAATPEPATNSSHDAAIRKKKQARRGAILNQRKNAAANPK